MQAEFVFDGNQINVPKQMGTPRADQMQGSSAEQLIELCGRICYDSLGTGRPSFSTTCPHCHGNLGPILLPPGSDSFPPPNPPEEGTVEPCPKCKGSGILEGYQEHLLKVRHFSVHEHVHVTFETRLDPRIWLGVPDVVVLPVGKEHRITLNLRHMLEFPDNVSYMLDRVESESWSSTIHRIIDEIAPRLIVSVPTGPAGDSDYYEIIHPAHEREAFISLYLEDSRVWSHEQVRHRGNMSQRSGRYVNESQTDLHVHPLLEQMIGRGLEETANHWMRDKAKQLTREVAHYEYVSRALYEDVVGTLERYAHETLGLDKLTARKQARSAGRYYLGNGLGTEMIFTASVSHWKHIFSMRCNPAADAAIKGLMEKARDVIKDKSQYGSLF